MHGNHRYKVGRLIQSGSFSVVHHAQDCQTGQDVALKYVRKPHDNPEQLQKVAALVHNEYAILRRLGTHRNICQLLDFYEDADTYVFVLEYCAYGDLYDFIKAIRERPTMRINFHSFLFQLCSAISYCHSKDVSHRDIKPENVLMDDRGQVKLTDFGLSQIGSVSKDYCIGTEKYLAPETFLREYHNTFATDYWSLGITIFCLMFGSCPFESASTAAPKRSANFQRFLRDPHRFVESYYLDAMFAELAPPASLGSLVGLCNADCAPSYWLELPKDRILFLCAIANLVITHLVNVDPAARDMHAFWEKVNALFLENGSGRMLQKEALVPQPKSCENDGGEANVPASPISRSQTQYTSDQGSNYMNPHAFGTAAHAAGTGASSVALTATPSLCDWLHTTPAAPRSVGADPYQDLLDAAVEDAIRQGSLAGFDQKGLEQDSRDGHGTGSCDGDLWSLSELRPYSTMATATSHETENKCRGWIF
ncbi:AEL284Cp [Eremothecium gossypii ATCC 10895]|uniref:non-specific serine/threonine protein kinase n=1 Tax=Eremothecium gossypii (strain ATCC 10895 / CBS 109.51 / FGSC 9923 / NRRL Y-1056) TaxID=284811 RepID=Q758N9_EREGS|nr:AEL284Cp [Eremothecium gossypii ATCC 10895]AAS52400.2 AEL284Cp [Eremothecium gossypii ATCC 10895]AEY96698.1 FAEL284Cp [Eremothecium gossypii FDAG1]